MIYCMVRAGGIVNELIYAIIGATKVVNNSDFSVTLGYGAQATYYLWFCFNLYVVALGNFFPDLFFHFDSVVH